MGRTQSDISVTEKLTCTATKDYKAFKPGVPANTPLDDRLNETSQAIKHIRKMKDCPAGVAFAPRLGALTDTEEANMVDPLSPTLCPGYTEEASGYGRKGVRATGIPGAQRPSVREQADNNDSEAGASNRNCAENHQGGQCRTMCISWGTPPPT